jgi:hypothetical protein
VINRTLKFWECKIRFARQLDSLVGSKNWYELKVVDPVTGTFDYAYLLCHSNEALNKILERAKLI